MKTIRYVVEFKDDEKKLSRYFDNLIDAFNFFREVKGISLVKCTEEVLFVKEDLTEKW